MDTRTLLSLLVLGVALSTAELIRAASPTVGALLLVALGILVAAVASTPSPASIGLGALAAMTYGALRPQAPIAAWGLFVLLVTGARALRARGEATVVLHGALAVLGGASAMWVTSWYAHAEIAARVASLVVASIVVGLPLVVPVDDPRTASLLALARRSRGPQRTRLLRAVALARRAERCEDTSRADRVMLASVFHAVERAAERGLRRSAREVDEALEEQLAAVARFLRALARRGDATLGLEARADVGLASAREAVELEARTLRELTG
jgi:hypothetical protein